MHKTPFSLIHPICVCVCMYLCACFSLSCPLTPTPTPASFSTLFASHSSVIPLSYVEDPLTIKTCRFTILLLKDSCKYCKWEAGELG